eukprot:TRINITY_DN2672_c0_g5_i2.p1 TRINITY_DN2672_c0_g5~~TRINITY_DN2672_c0_g5_i2.p1  ORF type:complete len:319 (+),score=105.89 TRINITY_DN2672_c0_g5_i2:570-1526(+)
MTSNGNPTLNNTHHPTINTTPTFTTPPHTSWLPHQNTTSTTSATTTQSSSSSSSQPKQLKGILKNPYNSSRKRRVISFDEENLNYNEENKSATMKINEPKTPYHYYDSEEEEVDVDVNEGGKWGMLETAVNREKIRQMSDSHSDSNDDSEHEHPRFAIGERDRDSEEIDKSKAKRKTKGYDVWHSDEDRVRSISIEDNHVNSENENISGSENQVENGNEEEEEEEDEESYNEDENDEEIEGSSENDDVSKRKEFKEKRKAHYNEFEMIRKMRELRQKGLVNEDDEDEGTRPNFFSGLVNNHSNGTSEEEGDETMQEAK